MKMKDSKDITFNLENFNMDSWIEQALAEGNHVYGYKESIEEMIEEGLVDDPEVGRELIRKAFNTRANIYRLKKERTALIERVRKDGMTPDLESAFKKVRSSLIGWGLEFVWMRADFDDFLALNDVPLRVRGRQPRNGALTQED